MTILFGAYSREAMLFEAPILGLWVSSPVNWGTHGLGACNLLLPILELDMYSLAHGAVSQAPTRWTLHSRASNLAAGYAQIRPWDLHSGCPLREPAITRYRFWCWTGTPVPDAAYNSESLCSGSPSLTPHIVLLRRH